MNAQAMVRRAGQAKYVSRIYDLSAEGCKIELIERPRLDELIWVKLDGIEALDATVCWIEGAAVGLEFQRPIHPAIFELLVKRLITGS